MAIETPVLVFICAMYLTGGEGSRLYTQSEVEALCRHQAGKAADWQHIVLHHSATSGGNAAIFDRHHRRKGRDELGYHFVIGNGELSGDGEIERGRRWASQKHGAHAGNERFNRQGIGICLVGDFEAGDEVTDAQFDALVMLCACLMRNHGIPPSNVVRHSDVKATQCPGSGFPFDALMRELTAELGPSAGGE